MYRIERNSGSIETDIRNLKGDMREAKSDLKKLKKENLTYHFSNSFNPSIYCCIVIQCKLELTTVIS